MTSTRSSDGCRWPRMSSPPPRTSGTSSTTTGSTRPPISSSRSCAPLPRDAPAQELRVRVALLVGGHDAQADLHAVAGGEFAGDPPQPPLGRAIDDRRARPLDDPPARGGELFGAAEVEDRVELQLG